MIFSWEFWCFKALFVFRCRHKSICENFGEMDFLVCKSHCDYCKSKPKVESQLKKYLHNSEGRSGSMGVPGSAMNRASTSWEDVDTSDLYGGGRQGISRLADGFLNLINYICRF